MVKFRFWVPAKGWAAGGYENAHFANDAKQAHQIVDHWNEGKAEEDKVVIREIKEITEEEFAEDYIG